MPRVRNLPVCALALAAISLPCFAADRVVFLRIAPTESTLYIAKADGSGERPLLPAGTSGLQPFLVCERRLDRFHLRAGGLGRHFSRAS